MKQLSILFFLCTTLALQAQQLQLHYDFRHSIDPELHRRNFSYLSFEYFNANDSLGSFLLKAQMDFNGEKNNIGQLFLQVSQNLRFWKPKVFMALNFTGGLGVTPPSYGYYLSNSFGLGAAYPFQWKGAWMNASMGYRYNTFAKPSHDLQGTLYFGKGFFNYKLLVAGSFVAYSENRNHGNEWTKDLRGKKLAFFGDPQIWYRIKGKYSIGSRYSMFYHVLTSEHTLQVYPSLALKREF
ncbi:MAG: DUF5020 family protein [Haliscomenobacter sp.]|uniref:DUF5020 family protein n=1 Tax=Haliscomenobacter sp. TaxID=2717303 RepID=UPI0029B5C855|nr:DUF5020 family protein [Haliscomenobacter sp.]MDX2071124.1 DUF5020 family protein [Haliscomenobacter sp.]